MLRYHACPAFFSLHLFAFPMGRQNERTPFERGLVSHNIVVVRVVVFVGNGPVSNGEKKTQPTEPYE